MLAWKTDWDKTDNHARAGADDLERLVNNYINIAERLNAVMGYGIILEDIRLLGFNMYPFADVLNTLERNLSEIFVLPITFFEGSKMAYYACGPWVCGSQRKIRKIEEGYVPVTWYPMKRAPNYLDVNRWERNGEALDAALSATTGIILECGFGACGEPITRQLFGDFYGIGAPGGRSYDPPVRLYIECGVGMCGEPLERQLFGDWR